jgi:4-amino-4-deoxy-L-arabinose transferase-like glycosyltransferase
MDVQKEIAMRQGVSSTKITYFSVLLAIAVLTAFLISFAFVGYTESDDSMYAHAARGWSEQFPYLPTTHWGLRHVLVLPMAALFWMFGENEVTLVMPMILAFIGLLIVSFVGTKRAAGNKAAVAVVILIISVPMFALNATTVTTDIPEAALILGSIWLFHFAWEDTRRNLFVGAGALAALACMTRETSIALVLFYGLLFLANYGGNRRLYIWMGVGFGVIIGIETVLLAWGSSDPLYRLSVSLKGVIGDNPSMSDQFKTEAGVDRFGNIAAPRWLSAFLVLFVNQNTGIICWLVVPVGLALAFRADTDPQSRVVRLFVGLAVTWFVTTSFMMWFLWILPRYQSVTILAFMVPFSIFLGRLLDKRKWLIPTTAIAALIGVEILIISVVNRNPLHGERSLVEFAREHSGPILTDPATLRGASWLLEREGLTERVYASTPKPGSIFFFNEVPRRPLPADWPTSIARSDWVQVASFDKAPNFIAKIIQHFGYERFIPTLIMRKLNPLPRAVRAYHVPG